MTKVGDARRTSVLDRATHVASVEGLAGVSFGLLADETLVPKSALQTLFRTKEELQLAIIKTAVDVFARTVFASAERQPEGLPRLRALMSAWVDYLLEFEGGCIFAAGASELDGHPGPVRDALAEAVRAGDALITRDINLAIRLGELPPDTDPDQLTFELHAMILQANHNRQLLQRDDALERARIAIERRLSPADDRHLPKHPDLNQGPTRSTGSRLVSGSTTDHEQLEDELAEFVGAQPRPTPRLA